MNRGVRITLLLASMLTLGVLAGCLASEPTPSAGTSLSPTQTHPTLSDSASGPPTNSSSLDPVLASLIEAENRTRYAQSNGLVLEEGRVRVIIELEPNATVPDQYELEIELSLGTDTGTSVQAMVAVSDLEPLAHERGVVEVRPPQTPVEQGP